MTVSSPTHVESLASLGLAEVREAFVTWIADNADRLNQFRGLHGDMDSVFAKLSELQRLLYDTGWIRLGWPANLGGLGGTLGLRGMISEELAAAGYPPPFSFATQEVLGPAVARFAPQELAAELIPRLLRGDEKWCQGFSEPGAGSDLASLRLRATDEGDSWRLNGEKIWTSWAKFADRCVLLARTGEPGSGHRGITAMVLDMDTPGIEVRPLPSIAGDDEFCSLYFDDVVVPKTRTLGEVNGGWAVAMFVLANERGAAAWQRQAWMGWRLGTLVDEAPGLDAAVAGEAFELIYGLRLLSRRTLRTLDRGESPGVLPSFDKILMSTAEKYLFDAAVEAMPGRILLGEDPGAASWRGEYLYSRASSIYGGTAEIQRNIIADRVLGLPKD
ncbi:acyl-CoA dehydrogenase family protein [Arthrobacter sp. I2-34]|uniref:Acyl-CoA dehydrogenase family protein n=1 Tax=Arthrobacter hankyongi TaxID=2904801 RepID=A0ABS9L3Q3_9MICC|nr:acyl-CoA dehydrogenase family protein [Arthrobacter hankyongi]MCG2621245.1 acyl-CoA dehydrogenase family protein [Arthrobacter hankyongi]